MLDLQAVYLSLQDSHLPPLSMIVWSSDGSKPYSSDYFARVFDSVSGTQLHHFEHDKPLHCVALSSKRNVSLIDDLASRLERRMATTFTM